ncbi:MAG: ABC transporter ATP-binding protein [Eubacteriales bacterium]|nr:ABC transporter ATP-binding protein [Eubacteriales bacterium]
MLKVDHVTASYKTLDGNVVAVEDVNFDIHDNEIFGIAGESGCGKSTMLKVLYDIIQFPLEIDSGRVVLDGMKDEKHFDIQTGEIHKSWWSNIAYIPQAAMSVLNPISRLRNQFIDSVPMERHDRKTETAMLKRVENYLEELNLSKDVLDAYPFQLSGGMRQRVIIALATFLEPNFILADEPTTALDVVVQRGILMLLMRYQKEHQNTIVIVSHDLGVHYQITDRIAIMYSGKIVEIGKTTELFERPYHPYTKMLIDALPKVGDRSARVGIEGTPPSLREQMRGCRFAPRCPRATEKCRQTAPEFREITPGRFAACHLLTDDPAKKVN